MQLEKIPTQVNKYTVYCDRPDPKTGKTIHDPVCRTNLKSRAEEAARMWSRHGKTEIVTETNTVLVENIKPHLRTGMILVNTCGEMSMVFKNIQTKDFTGDCIVDLKQNRFDTHGEHGWDDLDDAYDDNLKSRSPACQPSLNIVKILEYTHPCYFFTEPTEYNTRVIWERKT